VNGRRVELSLQSADSSDQAPRAVNALADKGVPVILGSYGSTISRPATDTAVARHTMFWETGAVGLLNTKTSQSSLVFRFPPTGASLGTAAVRFSNDVLMSRLHHDPAATRYGVTYVDDVYGQSVSGGMLDQIKAMGLKLVGRYPYALQTADYKQIVAQMVKDRVQVLLVVAYMDDGIAMRREMIKQHLHLFGSIGTSSSYCMHMFGKILDKAAVGLYASDKPDGGVVDPSKLSPEAADALRWAQTQFRKRYHDGLTAAAMTGFSGAWALFHYVLPNARSLTPDAIARAARAASVPEGSLPNASGLAFGAPGRVNAGDNLRAVSVIWEWVARSKRAVVWPPALANSPVIPLHIL
jgi:ABC-type branched-subunit amino acid transport system substrate-binding protein